MAADAVHTPISALHRITPIISGRMPRSDKLPILIFSQAKNQHFRPAGTTGCTDSREIWHDQGARGSAWPHEISRQSVHEGGNAAPKWQKLPLFSKESPADEPFDRFLYFLGPFIRPSILRFTFEMIRFAGYGVIVKKPHTHLHRIFGAPIRKNYGLDRKMINTF